MTTEERNALAVTALDRVEAAVNETAKRFQSPDAFRDDYRGAGYVALLRAAETFDPSRGVPFGAWAYTLILREMSDEWGRLVGGTRRDGSPTWGDPVRLDDPDDSEGFRELAVTEPPDPVDAVEVERIREVMLDVPDRENIILTRWSEGEPLSEIGASLGISRQRVHQLRDRAVERVRERVA
jgi:RNA polymerase sigma factor (sigma-70 family)